MQFNFSSVVITDLAGNAVPKVHEALANGIYTATKDLSLVETARAIYRGESVELSQTQLQEVKRIIEDEKVGFMAFVRDAYLTFIKTA